MIKTPTYVRPKHSPVPSVIPVKTRVSRKRGSLYRELLERLLDSPKTSVLRVKNVAARYEFEKQARALGFEAVFSQQDGWLYVKIGGVLNKEPQRRGPRVNAAQKSVLDALANQPMTAAELAEILRSDSASCEAVLGHLVETGFVERDDDLGKAIYRAMSGVTYGE